MDDAGAALRGVAADMGTGEAQVFAQKLDQQGTGVDIGANGVAVDDHGNLGSALGHSALSGVRPPHIDETAVKIIPKPIIWGRPAMGNLAGGMALCDLGGSRAASSGAATSLERPWQSWRKTRQPAFWPNL